jgi:hypothetical protein
VLPVLSKEGIRPDVMMLRKETVIPTGTVYEELHWLNPQNYWA